MKTVFIFGLVLATTFASSVRADENEDPKEILDRAIKALGRESNLRKYKGATWKERVKVVTPGMVLEGTAEVAMEWPGRHRRETRIGEFRTLHVLNGDKGWGRTATDTSEMDKLTMTAMRGDLYFTWIPTIVLPLREKTFKLEPTSEEKVGDRPAVGIKLIAPDDQVFRIYFDKENGLPVRMTTTVKDQDTGMEGITEQLYSEYKDVQGIKKAMKVVVKGIASTECQIIDFKFAEKLDDKLFAKP